MSGSREQGPARSTRVVAAFSGGKDSTAMVTRMAELGEQFTLLFTPTGNEVASLNEPKP